MRKPLSIIALVALVATRHRVGIRSLGRLVMNKSAQPRERGGVRPCVRRAERLVCALILGWTCVGCINTGPANRAEEFQHLALQLDSEPEQVVMAGKVVWCTGTDNLWELPPECVGEWEGEGVVLMTDQELAFFRWTDRGYVVTERVPYAQIQKVRLDRFHTTGKFVVIHTDDQPLIFLFQRRGILHSNTAAEATYEALMERVEWHRPEPAPL